MEKHLLMVRFNKLHFQQVGEAAVGAIKDHPPAQVKVKKK